ncbi:nuclear transport factor 2 family protein [Nostoc sp.]|uniref:nuclear transport factor 2 family protein n=1 Tax=Nostoc sp. TaxID=1180 RepID=UPI002FFA086B
MNTPILDLVKTFYVRLAAGDLDGALNLLASDVEWIAVEGFPTGGSYHSPQSVRNGVFARLAADWTEFSVVPERFIPAEGTVVVVGRYMGMYQGSNRRLNAVFAHVWEGTDERLAKFLQISDTALVRDAMCP